MSVRAKKKIPRPPAPMEPRAIIAVRGPPSPQKALIASKLANFFRYLLLDQDDVVVPSFPTDSIPRLTIQMLIQIASLNIKAAKIGIVINAELPEHTEIYQLLKLKRAEDVPLLIIQCLPLVGDTREASTGNEAYKMSVDTSKRFVLEDFLPDLIGLLFPKSDLARGMTRRWNETDLLAKHLHSFSLFQNPKSGKKNSECSRCGIIVSAKNSAYSCVECDEHVFHDTCCQWLSSIYGEDSLIEKFRLNCPPYLTGKNLSDGFQYNFPNTTPCRDCQITGFSCECFSCLFETHVKSQIVPTVINRERIHDHALSIVVAPIEVNYTYCCRVCGLTGKHVGFKCSECCVDFHPQCAMLPETVEKIHEHNLWLGKYSQEEYPYRDESNCWVCCECGESSSSWNMFYYCGEDDCTDVLIHPNCLIKESE